AASRKHDVQEHEMRSEFADQAQRLLAFARHARFERAASHQELERGDDALLVFGDDDALHAMATARSRPAPAAGSGSMNENIEPRPGALSTHKRPPRCSTICRQIARPSPVPAGLRV